MVVVSTHSLTLPLMSQSSSPVAVDGSETHIVAAPVASVVTPAVLVKSQPLQRWALYVAPYGKVVLPELLQASSHSADVHSRQPVPIFSQAASASSLVTFDHGRRPGTEQGRRVESKP